MINPRERGGMLSGWRKWLLVILFPVPFSPWWLTLTCLGVFALLLYALSDSK